jgi:tetratricopeptide (TPR) repeat protein/transcriptional regulator with XRE-family HTH domain
MPHRDERQSSLFVLWRMVMPQEYPDRASFREEFAQRLRQLLDQARLTQATLARRLRQRGFARVTEPRVSDWVHGRNLPREEATVFAIESILAEAGVATSQGDLVARYWAARDEPRQRALVNSFHRTSMARQALQTSTTPPTKTRVEQATPGIQLASGTPAHQAATVPSSTTGPAPPISNLPPRNPNFTGRDDLLSQLERSLNTEQATAVVAAHGLGGVGKSQLAMEYAHRHQADYDLMWWVPSETSLLVATSLAALASRLGLANDAQQEDQIAAVLAELARRARWLIVYDNAEQPTDLTGLRPAGGAGHVLITSRNPAWRGIATPIAVDVLTNHEAAAFLLRRTGESDRAAASTLAEQLGGLPLALEQAAAYTEQVGLSLTGYLDRYRQHHTQLLGRGAPIDYPATVVTTWRLNIAQVSAASPAAAYLLQLCAFLAPEAIPLDLLAADPTQLPTDLAVAIGNELALDEALGILYRYSLIACDQPGLRMHRLVQTALRTDLDPDQTAEAAERAVRLVKAAFPDEPWRPATWPQCGTLLPHALSSISHAEEHQVGLDAVLRLLRNVGIYLWHRAELHAAHQHLERAVTLATTIYGPDHPQVGGALNNLGCALQDIGDISGARQAFEQDAAIQEAALGPNHPAVAWALSNLGETLRRTGQLAAAKAHVERALTTLEGAYGSDHPELSVAVGTLGAVLHDLGDLTGARTRLEHAVALEEFASGPDSPQLGEMLTDLGAVLLDLGDVAEAHTCLERAFTMLQATVGENHPFTQQAQHTLHIASQANDPPA